MPLDDASAAPLPSAADQISAARDAGYSDQEIGAYMRQSQAWAPRFEAAAKAGYSEPQIFGHLGLNMSGQTEVGALGSAALKGLVGSAGSVLRGAGQATESALGRLQQRQLAVMDRIDQGERVPDQDNPVGYAADWTPEQKAAVRAQVAASGPNLVAQAGQHVADAAEKIPVEPAHQGFGTDVAETLGGLPIMLGAAGAGALAAGPVGGVIGAAAVIWPQSYDATYQDAITKGLDPKRADAAARENAAAQTALVSVPVARLLHDLTPALRDGVVKTMANLARSGVEFGSFNAMGRFVQNYITQQTVDPQQRLMEGVGDAALEGAVAGAVVPLAGAAVRAGVRMARPGEAAATAAPPTTPAAESGTAASALPSAPAAPSPAASALAAQIMAAGASSDVSSPKPIHATTPEPRADLAAQVKAVADPRNSKDAMFVAAGNEDALPADLHGLTVVRRPEGVLLTNNPAKAAAFQEANPLTEAHMAALLGYPETKTEAVASGAPAVAQATDATGAVVSAGLASPAGLPEAEAAARAQMPPGGAVSVVTPERAQQARTVAQIREQDGVDGAEAKLIQEREVDAIRRGETASAPTDVAPPQPPLLHPDAAPIPPTARPDPQSGGFGEAPLFQRDPTTGEHLPSNEAVQAFADAAQRIVGPHVRIEVYRAEVTHTAADGSAANRPGLMITHPDGRTDPVDGVALGRLIRVAVTGHTEFTLNHEAVHALRNLGVFTAPEWSAIESAARRENWMGHYDIAKIYPDLPPGRQLEEAIAQRFASFMRRPPSHDPFMQRIARKFAEFIVRIQNALAGRGFRTADDVFGKMASGEIGAREPGSGMDQRGPPSLRMSAELLDRWTGEGGSQFQRLPPLPATAPSVKQDPASKRAIDEIQGILSPTSRVGAKPMEYELRRYGAERSQSIQRATHALEDARRTVTALPEAEQLAVTDRAERGLPQPTQKLTDAMTALRKVQDEWLQRIRGLGKGYLDQAIDDYMGHIWSNYAEWAAGQRTPPTAAQTDAQNRAAAAAKRPLRGRGEFLKERTFDTQADGMAAGLIPATTNPIDMQLLKIRSMQRFYHGTVLAERLKQTGLARWVPVEDTHEAEARGFAKLDDTVFQPRIRSDAAYGVTEVGNWMAPEPAARVFNNYMSQGLMAHIPTIYTGLRGAAGALNGLQLGFSGFHATFMALDSMHSQMALALQQATRGQGWQAIKSATGTLAAPVTTFRRGAALHSAFLDPASATPEMRQVAGALISGGGRIGYDDFYRSTAAGPFFRSMKDLGNPKGAFREAWQMVQPHPGDGLAAGAGHILGGSLRVGGRIIDTMMHPLMGYAVPRMKLGVFAAMARDFIDRNPTATEEEATEAMTKAWDSVDNRMGELVYDNLFWNKTLKDTAFLTTRSVGWNVGTLRELGGAAVDTVAQGARLAKLGATAARGKSTAGMARPELTNRMAYALGMTVVSGILGAIMTKLATGHGPQQMLDYFYPPDGTTTGGVPNRLSIPGYIKDVIDWTHAPIQTAANKMNPLLETGIEIANNKDYYGGIIYHSGRDNRFIAYPEYLLNQVLPFSTRAMIKLHESKATPLQQMMGFWGIQPAPGSIVNPAKTQAWQERQDDAAYRKRLKENATSGRISLSP